MIPLKHPTEDGLGHEAGVRARHRQRDQCAHAVPHDEAALDAKLSVHPGDVVCQRLDRVAPVGPVTLSMAA